MGCSSSQPAETPELAEYFELVPHEDFQEKIVLIHGSRRNTLQWLPRSPVKAVVVVSHGLHEHGLRYYALAHALTALNYAVYAIDHYAHGKSDGTRGLISDGQILPRDFKQYAQSVRQLHPDVPFFVLCHSMGTLIALNALNDMPYVKVVMTIALPLTVG